MLFCRLDGTDIPNSARVEDDGYSLGGFTILEFLSVGGHSSDLREMPTTRRQDVIVVNITSGHGAGIIDRIARSHKSIAAIWTGRCDHGLNNVYDPVHACQFRCKRWIHKQGLLNLIADESSGTCALRITT